MPKNWRKLATDTPTNFKIFSVHREQYESPRTGQALNATIVSAADWVNVVALTPEQGCVLIRQYRFGTECVTLEIPGGMIDPGESPLVAAERELREETGYTAQRWTPLGRVAPNPAFQRNYLYTFLAEDCVLSGAQEQDPGEDIEVVIEPLAAVRGLIESGEIDHALVVVAFLRLEYLRRP
jgi:8-oxo-dGTP pyrophosphatase MutT (NUDIX family)